MNLTTPSETRIGIYADDLTGALDAAAPFTAAGMSVYVSVFGVVPDDDARSHRVLSLNIDTRHADRFPVFDRAARAAQELRAAGFTLLVNKIDSTLRGHAGMEARAGLTQEPSDPSDTDRQGVWSGPRLALMAPSFPAMGRTVIGGRVLVDGVPLAESEVGRDPFSPVPGSEIGELVERNTGIRPVPVTLGAVRDSGRLRAAISEMMDSPPVLAVCDAVSDDDLTAIATAGIEARGDIVLSGSAGITNALARALSGDVDAVGPGQSTSARSTPALIISGSQRTVTERQLEMASSGESAEWLQLDPGTLLDDEAVRGTRDQAVARAVNALEEGRNIAISLTRTTGEESIDVEDGVKLVRELGAISYRITRRTRPGALVIIGGDTAQSVLRAGGAAGIVLHDEPFPGVPAGTIDGGLLDGVRVVTKAGAFGDEDVLVKVIDCLS
ncbi:MAG TPA: four-carbon acid sugar kinase family protein [Dehalococcoidia bacterium]|jgi:uncharacterized protein YgbK (DUF1537 family)|nr:four-carbon acid sugar kinase family protein [Dehalococcoidia bacterium]HJM53061.1 four-carbon acid sugar kinase family protein [Dehalococcoidia bacterium]